MCSQQTHNVKPTLVHGELLVRIQHCIFSFSQHQVNVDIRSHKENLHNFETTFLAFIFMTMYQPCPFALSDMLKCFIEQMCPSSFFFQSHANIDINETSGTILVHHFLMLRKHFQNVKQTL